MAEDRELRQQELARLILQKARQDLEAMMSLRNNKRIADEIVGFHVQQAVEKALKAALTRIGVEYEFTHDLATLYEQAETAGLGLPTSLDRVDGLTVFAVRFRYTLFEDESSFDRQASAALAETFIAWAHGVVEMPVGREGREA